MILPINSPNNTATCSPGTISTGSPARPASATQTYAANGTSTVEAAARSIDRVELSDRGRLLALAASFTGPNHRQAALSAKVFAHSHSLPGLASLAEQDVRPDAIENARRLIESGELFSRDALRRAARKIRPLLG